MLAVVVAVHPDLVDAIPRQLDHEPRQGELRRKLVPSTRLCQTRIPEYYLLRKP